MSFLFPILEARTLPELKDRFAQEPAAQGIAADETDLFFQEVAMQIAQCGKPGVEFLLDSLPDADDPRARGILVGLGFADLDSTSELHSRIRCTIERYLQNSNPKLVAQAVDCANQLGEVDLSDRVRILLRHDSPYVIGSVLRFLAAHYPGEAKPLLFEALNSPQAVIRENAIDELDELECKEALPRIASHLNDPDQHVRDAAKWAVTHLQSA